MSTSDDESINFVTVELWGEFVGEKRHGVWCDHCMLPSGCIYQLVTGFELTITGACRHFVCFDCGTMIHLEFLQLRATPREATCQERYGE